LFGVDDYNLSQIVGIRERSTRPRIGCHFVTEPTLTLPDGLAAADPLKVDTVTASILRTHSQCQRGSSRPNITVLAHGEPFLFIPGNLWSVSR
jgi:hypothetical protein